MDEHNGREALQAFERLKERVLNVEQQSDDLDGAVFGDERQGRDGLVKDMKVVQAFIIKWDKREHTVRFVVGLLSANIVLTILGIIASFLLGGR